MIRLSNDELKKLSNQRILGLYKIEKDGCQEFGYYCGEEGEDELIEYTDYINDIKGELHSRGHIPSGKDRKNERQRLAKKHKRGRGGHKKK